jgi:hypothetical protein
LFIVKDTKFLFIYLFIFLTEKKGEWSFSERKGEEEKVCGLWGLAGSCGAAHAWRHFPCKKRGTCLVASNPPRNFDGLAFGSGRHG